MAAKGSALSRAVRYFREADIDEAEVAFELVKRVLAERLGQVPKTTAPKAVRKQRKAHAAVQAAGAGNPETLANA